MQSEPRAPSVGKLLAVALIGAAAMFRAGVAQAQVNDADGVQVHAFVSQGFVKTTENDYLAESKRGSFEFTEVGINFTTNLSPQLRVGMQLFAHDLGPLGNYAPTFDWYHLDYHFRDWLGIRAGRVKIPFGLYNDSADIDAARVPILLPQSIYPIDHRDYLLAQTGGELYGTIPLGPVGGLEYRGYGGTLDLKAPANPSPGITVSDLEIPYVYGGRVTWLTPLEGLVASGSYQALRFDWHYNVIPELVPLLQMAQVLPANFTAPLEVQFRVKLWVASLEYQTGDLTLSAEYSRWIGKFNSEAPTLLPPHTVNERYYGMASYRVLPWFTPGAYYSVYYPDRENREPQEAYQRDLALSLRFDINQYWLAKVEGHWMHGTAALDPALNDGKALKDLEKDWGALLVKTTAYF